MQHDSYHCGKYEGALPFPSQREREKNNFVGAVVSRGIRLKKECPRECRPKSHKDWKNC